MIKNATLALGLLAALLPQLCIGAQDGPKHQNSAAPLPLSPQLKDSGSVVLERMAAFLDDYKNNFRNHTGCESGKTQLSYGYLKCEEEFSNGTYITTQLLTEDVVHLQQYAAVFYRYSGADAAVEKERLVAIVEHRLSIDHSDGSWDPKFPDDENFNGYHYHWAGSEVFKLWIRLVDQELQVSATANLSRAIEKHQRSTLSAD